MVFVFLRGSSHRQSVDAWPIAKQREAFFLPFFDSLRIGAHQVSDEPRQFSFESQQSTYNAPKRTYSTICPTFARLSQFANVRPCPRAKKFAQIAYRAAESLEVRQ